MEAKLRVEVHLRATIAVPGYVTHWLLATGYTEVVIFVTPG